MAMENPKLRAILPNVLNDFLPGNRAVISAYPGKKNTKGKPTITRKTLDGKRVIVITSRIAKIFINRSPF